MHGLRLVLTGIGGLALLVGLFWIGQGLGFIHWPSSDPMIGQRERAIRGAALVVVGVIALLRARRRR